MKHPITALVIAAAATLAGVAQAQTVYRIVGPDGKVTFSDKPPASADQGKVTATGIGASGAASMAALPYELRQVVQRYPVTLYSAEECAPCASGRSLLVARGVPFVERSIKSTDDLAALTRIGGDTTMPLLTVGGQKLRGFSSGEWSQYLDLAGYPKTSVLPASYRQPAATPLVPASSAAAAPRAEEAVAPPATPSAAVPSGPTESNPAGIKF